VALLGPAIGSLASMPVAGWLVARVGSGRMTVAGALIFFLVLTLPPFTGSQWTLLASLIGYGVGAGLVDVSMNVQAVGVETRTGRAMMSSFHGLYSVGGLAGSAAGGLVASLGIGPRAHLVAVGLLLAGSTLAISHWFLPRRDDVRPGGPAFARPSRALLSLGVIAFCALLGEGAIADWSAVYLRALDSGPGLAAAGFAVFSVTMALGRLSGDWLIERAGAAAVVRLCGVIAAVGLGVSLLLARPLAALAGFACIGLGLSIVFPAALSAAGYRVSGSPGGAIAAVSTTGYFGFLVGPPTIGFVAGGSSLRVALGIVVLLSLAIALLAGSVGRPPSDQPINAVVETEP
jgi:MFS family permease